MASRTISSDRYGIAPNPRSEGAHVELKLVLYVEALVADADAEWSSEFSEVDRTAARGRLGTMIEVHATAQQAVEAEAVAHDKKIIAQVNERRIAKGKPGLTGVQEAEMLKARAARRAAGD